MPADTALTVGIDIGTTSIKGVVVDREGTVVARQRRIHAVDAPTAGRLSHDAADVWHDGVQAVWEQLRGEGTIAAITVSAMVPSMAPVDADGRPIGPGLLYGDERGSADPSPHGELGELASFAAWAASAYPDAAGYWPAQAVANGALTGTGAIDSVMAIMASPLSDGATWDVDACAAVGAAPEQFPVIGSGHEPIGQADGALVSGGTVDALAEQLVAGADEVGDVLVICGTTLIVWAVADDWPEAEGLWTVPHTSGHAAIGGPSNAGGMFLERVRYLVGERGEAGLAAVEPGRVPVWDPHIRGERVPYHDRERRASLHGLDVGHQPGDVLQAAYEASAFTVRAILERSGVAVDRIVATGGGTHVDPWIQALADATGQPIQVVATPEGAALGAAYMSRVTAGLEPDTSGAGSWARIGRVVEPRTSWIEPCAARYEQFRQLTDRSDHAVGP